MNMNSAAMPAPDRTRPRSSLTEEAERLVQKYPNITDEEIDRLVAIFPKLPVLDVGLMTSDDSLASRLEAFHREHGRRIRMPLPHQLLFLSVAAVLVLIILWAMLAH
jgi:hypothetical protein